MMTTLVLMNMAIHDVQSDVQYVLQGQERPLQDPLSKMTWQIRLRELSPRCDGGTEIEL